MRTNSPTRAAMISAVASQPRRNDHFRSVLSHLGILELIRQLRRPTTVLLQPQSTDHARDQLAHAEPRSR